MCFTVQLSRFLSFWQLWYFIISFSACQELFSFFWNFFLSCFRSFLSFVTANLDYHILLGLSRTFFKLFKVDCQFFLTALIEYHIFYTLSTTFFIFWKFVVFTFFCMLKNANCHLFSSDSLYRISHVAFRVNYFFIVFRLYSLHLSLKTFS